MIRLGSINKPCCATFATMSSRSLDILPTRQGGAVSQADCAVEAGFLPLGVEGKGRRQRAAVEDDSEHGHVDKAKVLFDTSRNFAPRGVRLQNEDDAIGPATEPHASAFELECCGLNDHVREGLAQLCH